MMNKDIMIDAISAIDEKYVIEYVQYETKLSILKVRKKKKSRNLLICAACLALVVCMLAVSLPLSFIVLRSEPARELGNQVIENVLFPLDKEQVAPDDPDAPISPEQEKLILNWIEWEITEITFTALGAGTPQSKIDVLKSVEDGWFDEFLNRLGVLLERMYDYYLRHKKEIDEIIGLPESTEQSLTEEQIVIPDVETTRPEEDTSEPDQETTEITEDDTTEQEEQTTLPELMEYTDSQNVMYRASQDGTHWIVLGRTEEAKQKNEKFSLVIPNSIDGFAVKEIQDYAFYEEEYLIGLLLPDGLEIIGEWAFAYTNITELVLPTTLTHMGELAFSNNRSLKTVQIPGGITELQHGVFLNCIELEQVYLHDNIKIIGTSAFSRCSRLVQINMPQSLEVIGGSAFDSTIRLNSIQIPENVVEIGYRAFADMGALAWEIKIEELYFEDVYFDSFDIVIPDGVTTITESTFLASGLKKVTIPKSVTKIEWCAFGNCYLMNEIEYLGTIAEWQAITTDAYAFGILPLSLGSVVPDFPLVEIRVVCTDGELIIPQVDVDVDVP